MINTKGEFMEYNVLYSPTSSAITQIIDKSATIARDAALGKRPVEQATKLHIVNIELMTAALGYITDRECHARAERTIALLQRQIGDMAAA